MAEYSAAEARLKIAESIYSVIYNHLDKGSESPDELMEARLMAEDVAASILDEIIIDIAPEPDEDDNIIAAINSYEPYFE